MNPLLERALVLGGLLLAATSGWGQTVYRCGNAYQDKPCPGAVIVDAAPSRGMEIRSAAGAVVHSRAGDKARNERTLEQHRENAHNALNCGMANDQPTVQNGRIDCPTAKAEREAKRLAPDYIRK